MINLYDAGILDLLPESFRKKPEVRALSYAIKMADRRRLAYMRNVLLWDVDVLPEWLLDAIAAELNSPYYDASMSIEDKRQTIKDTLLNYRQAGSRQAVQRMITAVYGGGYIEEWHEYGGTPGTFRIYTPNVTSQEELDQVKKMLRRVKNARSTLDVIVGGTKQEGPIYIGCLLGQIKFMVED